MARMPWNELLSQCMTTPEATEDDELLRRFSQDKDQTAFELIVWRHGSRVFRLCHSMLRDTQEAEDVFQATFLVLARKCSSVLKKTSVASWLHKVAYRLCLRAYRARTRFHQTTAPHPADFTTDGDIADGEEREILHAEILRLPEKYRTAVALCYFAGLSTTKAAEQLGCPRGTILSRLAAARNILRKRLKQRGMMVTSVSLAALGMGSIGEAATPLPTTLLVQATCQAATLVAAGTWTIRGLSPHASARAVELMEGTMNVLILSKAKWLAALTVLLLLSAGLGAWVQQPGPSPIVAAPVASPVQQLELLVKPAQAEPIQPVAMLPPIVAEENPKNPQPDGNTVIITRPSGDWERVVAVGPVTGTIAFRFEGSNKLQIAVRVKADASLQAMLAGMEPAKFKMPNISDLEIGIKLDGEYSMASDGLLYGIFTGCELETESLRKINLPLEESLYLHAALAVAEAGGGLFIDQPFSMRFRQHNNALTIKDLKFLGLDLLANFMPGGPAAYQAVVTGRYKKANLNTSLEQVSVKPAPAPIMIKQPIPEKPVQKSKNEVIEKELRQAEAYAVEGKVAQAYYQYELIRKRYPGTRYATEAATKAGQLLEKEGK
jgi:RNA polymerase sigma factor (sigma-70 family)